MPQKRGELVEKPEEGIPDLNEERKEDAEEEKVDKTEDVHEKAKFRKKARGHQ
ncbi:MAG: hypothetical protein OK456_05950 [Thaumarchaeota archaeon]|nr:hypothetical protein [Nitrososphaerota archaeon]